MSKGPSVVNLFSMPVGVGTCELCGQEGHPRPRQVVVHLATGAAVQFAACAPCITALQQLGLDSEGFVRFAIGKAPATIPPAGAVALIDRVPNLQRMATTISLRLTSVPLPTGGTTRTR